MKFKPNYISIPLFVIMVAILGSMFSSQGMGWYNEQLVKPDLTPPSWVFPVAWSIIFALTAVSALILWNRENENVSFLMRLIGKTPSKTHWFIVSLFVSNAILNVFWSSLFFAKHWISASLVEMMLLNLTTILLIVLGYKYSRLASLLLLPYFLWVSFATYLTYQIYLIN
ncbi:MAG: TspO/MBR family protein [Candidatus Gracilibacteria bacterium]|jgi:tryptophan-rich sensory protein